MTNGETQTTVVKVVQIDKNGNRPETKLKCGCREFTKKWAITKKLCSKHNKQRLQKIRNRGSYAQWKILYNFIKKNPKDSFKILNKIHETLDGYHAYGSETNSFYSLESLKQFKKDNKI
jgi:hypothetical protein